MRKVLIPLYRALGLALCLFGLAIQLGLLTGQPNPGVLIFFTIQSNLVCAALWIALLIRPQLPPVWHGIAAQGILLTMVVYHFLLAGGTFSMSSFTGSLYGIANLLVHYVVPTMMIVDFLILTPRQYLRRFAPLCWAIFPLAYFGFAMIHGATGRPIYKGATTSYPYFFIDPKGPGLLANPQGFGGVILYAIVICAVYIAAGYAMRAVYLLIRPRKTA